MLRAPSDTRLVQLQNRADQVTKRPHLELRIGSAMSREEAAFDQLLPMIEPMLRANSDKLVQIVEEASLTVSPVEKPSLPHSTHRYAKRPPRNVD